MTNRDTTNQHDPQSEAKAAEKTSLFGNAARDARQTDDAEIKADCRLFRKRYRALSPAELALHDKIKDKASELALLIGVLEPFVYTKVAGAPMPIAFIEAHSTFTAYDPAGVTLALRHLEDAVYRAVKALTA